MVLGANSYADVLVTSNWEEGPRLKPVLWL